MPKRRAKRRVWKGTKSWHQAEAKYKHARQVLIDAEKTPCGSRARKIASDRAAKAANAIAGAAVRAARRGDSLNAQTVLRAANALRHQAIVTRHCKYI